jgi:FkbM family methyltransferase
VYYGQNGLDKYIYETFFIGVNNGFFIECGAFDGLIESTCKFFEDSLGWTGINIEPVPTLFDKLKHNRPNCANLNLALSDKNCIAEFIHTVHSNKDYGCGSITLSEEYKNNLITRGFLLPKFSVRCQRFCDLGIKNHIDLFVLDVEGHELEALSGILPTSYLPHIFCIEYNMIADGINAINSVLSDKYNFHSTYQHNVFYVKREAENA